MSWATEALGLPADADARAIKRAYAARLKTTRPDDDPALFQQLHEIYQAALAAAALPDAPAAASAVHVATTPAPEHKPAVEVTPDESPAVEPGPRLVELVQDAGLEAELRQLLEPDYVQSCAKRILDAACTLPEAELGPWLHAQTELWSLAQRPRIGRAIANLTTRPGLIIPDAAYAALIDYFSLEEDGEHRQAFWTLRIVEAARRQAPAQLADWLAHHIGELRDEERAAVGYRVLHTLRTEQTDLCSTVIEALSSGLGWNQLDLDDDDLSWLHHSRRSARAQERLQRRRAALDPASDGAALAAELKAAHWPQMTPQWAATLRAHVTGAPSLWRCFLFALLPARPKWMYRFCGILSTWLRDGEFGSLQLRHVHFWTQLGNAQHPHGWQLAVGTARGVAVAAAALCYAALVLPFTDPAAVSGFCALVVTALAVWIALILVQMGARWQTLSQFSSRIEGIAHFWAIPAAAAATLYGARNGLTGVFAGTALAYMAIQRMSGRMDEESRFGMKACAVGFALIFGLLGVAIEQLGAWLGAILAVLVWLVSLAQEAQRRALMGRP